MAIGNSGCRVISKLPGGSAGAVVDQAGAIHPVPAQARALLRPGLTRPSRMCSRRALDEKSHPMNRATILLLVGSGLLAAAALWWSITMSMSIDAPMSSSGWGAMIAGIVVTFVLGVVLMSLVFLSSRRGYDKPPDQVEKQDGSDSEEQDRN
jgi:hypothetical protein